MSALHAFASATANPLLVITRLLLGLFLVWLGVTKLIPDWNSHEVDAALLMSAFTGGKIDAQVGMYLLGGVQVVTGLALCIVPALELSFLLLWVLMGLYITLGVLHHSDLFVDYFPTPLAQLIIRNCLLTLAALAVAAYTIKVAAPKAKPTPK